MSEECDTNGDLTCCNRMCQIVDGCTCTHFYIGIWHQTEWASYQSLCTNPDDEAYDYILPSNSFYFQNHALSQNPVVGLNGQLRLIECSDVAADCFGVSMGYQGAGTTTPYTDQYITMYQLSSGATAVTSATDLVSRTLKGKQRNTFGSFNVYNENLQSVTIDKLTSSGFSTTYTTTAEDAVQLLGAHEFYWWGWGSQLLAKLSDGISFKFFRVASDWDLVSDVIYTPSDVEKIETEQKNLWHVPDHTVVPPVFVQDVAVFFVVDSTGAGNLDFYKWNVVSNFFELQTRIAAVTSVASGWETETSLIRTTDGVIFKESGVNVITHY